MMKTQFGISAVVCCFNGVSRLSETLEHLSRQENVSEFPCELVFVDNESTDGSAQFIEQKWEDLGRPFPLRVVLEQKQGVAHARQTGVNCANNEFIVFIDDDNWIEPYWFERIYDVMISNPNIGVLASYGDPVTDKGNIIPEWFEGVKHGYATGRQNLGSVRKQSKLTAFYSAGMTLRKSAMKQAQEHGFQHLLVSRSGDKLTSGEDSEMTYVIMMLGWDAAFDPTLRFKHYMPVNRLTSDYACRLFQGLGESTGVQDIYVRMAEGVSKGSPRALRRWLISRIALAHIRSGVASLLARFAGDDVISVHQRVAASFFSGRASGCMDALDRVDEISAQIRSVVGQTVRCGRLDPPLAGSSPATSVLAGRSAAGACDG